MVECLALVLSICFGHIRHGRCDNIVLPDMCLFCFDTRFHSLGVDIYVELIIFIID